MAVEKNKVEHGRDGYAPLCLILSECFSYFTFTSITPPLGLKVTKALPSVRVTRSFLPSCLAESFRMGVSPWMTRVSGSTKSDGPRRIGGVRSRFFQLRKQQLRRKCQPRCYPSKRQPYRGDSTDVAECVRNCRIHR